MPAAVVVLGAINVDLVVSGAPLPMMARTPSARILSAPTASAMSPCSSVEFGHGSGSLSVVDATYLDALLSMGPNRLSGC